MIVVFNYLPARLITFTGLMQESSQAETFEVVNPQKDDTDVFYIKSPLKYTELNSILCNLIIT